MEGLRFVSMMDNFSSDQLQVNSKFSKIDAADARRLRKNKLAELRRNSRASYQSHPFGRSHVADRRRSKYKRSGYGSSLPRTNSASSEIEDEDMAMNPKKEEQRQQRMLRNRESAAQSRKRKREEYEKLEDKIRMLTKENEALKKKIEMYENSCLINTTASVLTLQTPHFSPSSFGSGVDIKNNIQQLNSTMEGSEIDCQGLKPDTSMSLPTNLEVPGNSSSCSFNREFAVPANSYT